MPFLGEMSDGLTKPPLGAQINPEHPLFRGLESFWALNEATGKTGFGQGPKQRNMTLQSGVTWVGSLRGPAIKTASSAYGTATTALGSSTRTAPAAFTMAIRFNTSSVAAATIGVMSLAATTTDSNPSMLIARNGAQLRALTGDSAYQNLITTMTVGTWYTVVAVWDGANETYYVNGAKVYSGALTWAPNTATTKGNVYLGTGFNGQHSGNIEFGAIWSRALTAAEAADFSAAPYSIFLPDNTDRFYVPAAAGGGVTLSIWGRALGLANDSAAPSSSRAAWARSAGIASDSTAPASACSAWGRAAGQGADSAAPASSRPLWGRSAGAAKDSGSPSSQRLLWTRSSGAGASSAAPGSMRQLAAAAAGKASTTAQLIQAILISIGARAAGAAGAAATLASSRAAVALSSGRAATAAASSSMRLLLARAAGLAGTTGGTTGVRSLFGRASGQASDSTTAQSAQALKAAAAGQARSAAAFLKLLPKPLQPGAMAMALRVYRATATLRRWTATATARTFTTEE